MKRVMIPKLSPSYQVIINEYRMNGIVIIAEIKPIVDNLLK
jgi:hypothetical protein